MSRSAHNIARVEHSTWSLPQAIIFFNQHRGLFEDYGFTACLYGSVIQRLTAAGEPSRDLDIMAVAFRPGARALDCAEALCNALSARLADHEATRYALCYAVVLPDGRVLDLQFRDHARRCPACGEAEL
jgi:hypothetical protein